MKKLFFADNYDDVILFSLEGSRAVEVTFGGLKFSDQIQPLFENGKVTEPLPVMVEGTYHIYDAAANRWVETTITAADIHAYFHNTPRDVAINYDHRRGGEAKGWLRLKDTGRIGKIQTRDGEKVALFASMELFEQAYNDVKRGYFRDVSIELKPISKEIIGNALTSYPIMRDVQFSQVVAESELPADGATVKVDDTPAEPEGTPATEESSAENPTEESQVNEQEKQAAVAEYLQQFGLTPEDLAAMPAVLQTIREQEQAARLTAAKAKVTELVTREDGKAVLAPGAIDAAAQLFAFCEDNASLNFSVNGENLSPTALLEKVFAGIEAVQVFGAVIDGDDVVANAQQDPPTVESEGRPAVDTARVNSLVARIKANLAAG